MLGKACSLRKTLPTGTAQNPAVMMVTSFFFFFFKIEKALVNIHFEDKITGVD